LNLTRARQASPLRSHLVGLGFAVTAATLWGLSGVAAQLLFQVHNVEPRWLVTIRLLAAGFLLLALARPAFPRRHWRWLAVYAILGVAAVQYTWYLAIALSNVTTASFLQYTYVAMTAGWEIMLGRIQPTPVRLAALAAAGVGVALLVLGQAGGLHALELRPLGVVFGLLSAVTATFYAVSGARLSRVVGAWSTAAWGFLIGAVPMVVLAPPWNVHPTGSLAAVAGLTVFVVVAGTALAFTLFLLSVRRISPTEAVVACTAEPAVAALVAALFLGVTLAPAQYLGGALIVVAVVLLAFRPPAAAGPMPL
jgi:drug/metabolite transporter (DMT)-like permease